MVSRRRVIAGISVLGSVTLAGCAGALTDASAECSITQIVDGGACEVEVENNAYPGELEVVLETRDANENIVGTNSKVVDISIGDTKRINLNPELHRDIDHVTASVEGA